ncbi:single-stranded DNA-binding protein [Xanthomonas campestris]|uniref:single-stranded DNA-binding protein n=1 Tax=Xanthomonas campestris TaxID=339 RepID=UPI000C1E2B8A|nr:single-stranded DNA-binding protein [Xanthomonas campestris]
MSGIKVTVLSAEVDERGGTFKDDRGEDREYTTRKQKAKLEAGGFAYPLDLRIEKGQAPYQPGEYELDFEAMVTVNKGAINYSKFHVLRAAKPARATA